MRRMRRPRASGPGHGGPGAPSSDPRPPHAGTERCAGKFQATARATTTSASASNWWSSAVWKRGDERRVVAAQRAAHTSHGSARTRAEAAPQDIGREGIRSLRGVVIEGKTRNGPATWGICGHSARWTPPRSRVAAAVTDLRPRRLGSCGRVRPNRRPPRGRGLRAPRSPRRRSSPQLSQVCITSVTGRQMAFQAAPFARGEGPVQAVARQSDGLTETMSRCSSFIVHPPAFSPRPRPHAGAAAVEDDPDVPRAQPEELGNFCRRKSFDIPNATTSRWGSRRSESAACTAATRSASPTASSTRSVKGTGDRTTCRLN